MKFRDEETNGRMSNYEEVRDDCDDHGDKSNGADKTRCQIQNGINEHIQMMAWLEQERLEGERERGEGDTYVVYQVGLARQSKIY